MKYQQLNGRRCVLIGEQSLLMQCGAQLLEAGFPIVAVVTSNDQCRAWAQREGVCVKTWSMQEQSPPLDDLEFDILLSITNLRMLPASFVEHPQRVAINFHDGPLPEMRGLNTPMWALLQGQTSHQINWHVLTAGVDMGDVLVTENLVIEDGETAFTLNAKCYAAALVGFERVLDQLKTAELALIAQPDAPSVNYQSVHRPEHLGVIQSDMTVQDLQRLVQALDCGPYENPMTLAKLVVDEQVFHVRSVQVLEGAPASESPGTILEVQVDPNSQGRAFTIKAPWGEQVLSFDLTPLTQGSVDAFNPQSLKGRSINTQLPGELDAFAKSVGQSEAKWVRDLQQFPQSECPYIRKADAGPKGIERETVRRDLPEHPQPLLAIMGYFSRLADDNSFGFGLVPRSCELSLLSTPIVPISVTFTDEIIHESELVDTFQRVRARGPIACDLVARQRVSSDVFRQISVFVFEEKHSFEAWVSQGPSSGIAIFIEGKDAGAGRIEVASMGKLVKPLESIVDEILAFVARSLHQPFHTLDLLTPEKFEALQLKMSGTVREISLDQDNVLAQFQQQVEARPDEIAVVFQNQTLSTQALQGLALKVASCLRSKGVQPGDFVGLMMPRGIHLMPAMLGILYAGAAFVPMDPEYPMDRLEHMATDSKLSLILCEEKKGFSLSQVCWSELQLELAMPIQPNTTPDERDLAYMIYTSGSTGLPKGVMVGHLQLANFCCAMTDVIPHGAKDAWLAVTSISFDISILELLWTLCRGVKLVIYNGSDLRKDSASSATKNRQHQMTPIEFSLFYWNLATHEDAPGSERYRVLLEGAKFGDENDFAAVWTPERHFGEFGGLYPNPAVSSAAIAATTKNIHIRAGSCVVPLHHPIRVAEDWAMIDNLSDGRVGLSAAAGWMPNDFVILPDNFENAKEKMFSNLEQIRQLWRGEEVVFPGPRGDIPVKTLPRPVQKELPVWVTTAGNPDNFRRAGELGLNLLTHLLGQTTQELGEKIRIYQDAWRAAGHTGSGHVSLMLHTFVAPTDAQAKSIAREPMKNYLRTALFLVKSAAWEFPTFKKLSENQEQTLDDYFANISDEDMDALLDFAFERYYATSGLFGSPERCVEIVDSLKGIGVSDIACLIDYGIETQTVLDHLPLVKQVMEASRPNRDALPGVVYPNEFGLAQQFKQHKITHFQCTPSMARLITLDESIEASLGALAVMMVGGEALPLDLAQALQKSIKGPLLNMYGPTETTIWSSVDIMSSLPEQVTLGQPILNTQLAVMNASGRPVPTGCIGELYIGGQGVVPGYWQREELNLERFVQDATGWSSSGRWYRTGDLVRFDVDGALIYLGRNDFQVKIRGYRIELGEIETQMLRLAGIREAVVSAVVTEYATEPRLVGYYTLDGESTVDTRQLQQWLSASLASFMVPSAYVELDAMPLTPNGKIDRKRLPDPQLAIRRTPVSAQGAPVKPKSSGDATSLQQAVLDIWIEVLGEPQLSIDDNFFESGGHSLLVVDVISRLKPLFQKPVRLIDFFRFPQVRTLVAYLSEQETEEKNTAVESAQSRGAARRAARRGR